MRDIQMLYVKLEGNFSMKEKVVVDKAISLYTDSFGDPAHEPIILIMGAMSSGPAGLQNKTCFLPCVLRNAHDAAPYAGTDSGCQLFFFTQPLTCFSVKINAQAVRLAMIYVLKIYLLNSIY